MSSTKTRRPLSLALAAALTALIIVGIDSLARPDETRTIALRGAEAATVAAAAAGHEA